jgi:hypothetical protein
MIVSGVFSINSINSELIANVVSCKFVTLIMMIFPEKGCFGNLKLPKHYSIITVLSLLIQLIMLVNSVAKSTFDISNAPGVTVALTLDPAVPIIGSPELLDV